MANEKTDESKVKGAEKMERYTFRMPDSLLLKAKGKAGMVPLSRVIRRLIEKWVAGEIEIND